MEVEADDYHAAVVSLENPSANGNDEQNEKTQAKARPEVKPFSRRPQQPSRRLLISALPEDTMEEKVEDMCKPFGEVLAIELRRDKSGRGKFAMVDFADVEASKRAFEQLNDGTGENCSISVRFGVEPSKRTDRRRDERREPPRRFGSDRPQRNARQSERMSNRHITIHGMDRKLDWRELKDTLREIGDVKFADQRPDGSIIAEFRGDGEAQRVAELLNRGERVFGCKLTAEPTQDVRMPGGRPRERPPADARGTRPYSHKRRQGRSRSPVAPYRGYRDEPAGRDFRRSRRSRSRSFSPRERRYRSRSPLYRTNDQYMQGPPGNLPAVGAQPPEVYERIVYRDADGHEREVLRPIPANQVAGLVPATAPPSAYRMPPPRDRDAPYFDDARRPYGTDRYAPRPDVRPSESDDFRGADERSRPPKERQERDRSPREYRRYR